MSVVLKLHTVFVLTCVVHDWSPKSILNKKNTRSVIKAHSDICGIHFISHNIVFSTLKAIFLVYKFYLSIIITKNTDLLFSHFIMYDHEWRERASNAAVYRVQILIFFFLKKRKQNKKRELHSALQHRCFFFIETKPSKINK